MVIKMKYERVLIQTEEASIVLVILRVRKTRSCSGVRENLRIRI